jgi:hypothetical protein
MAFDFKAATPGTAPASSLLFGADSQVAANPSVYTSTGSGNVVLSTSPTLVTPTLGTPASGTLTNCTGLPVGGISGLGTGVATALAVNVGSAGAFVTFGGALGTPSSGTLTNCTGLPVGGISATGTPSATTFLRGDGTWATPSGGSGTVTSVAQSFTGGLISVGGSPVTTSGTLALTVAGTSGGVPYFSSTSAWASSAALAANAIVLGGGAGAAPATTTTGTGVVTAIGNAVNTNGGLVTASTASIASGAILTGAGSGTAISAITPGAGIATWLATPSSANLAAAVTDETGTGPLVFANSPTFTDDITLGTQQTTQGAVILANTAAGAFSTTIKSSNSASAAWTLTLPTTAGTNNYVLKTDGSGNTSWVAQSGGGGSPGGNSGQYQYNNAGAFAGIGLILFADTTFYVRTDGNNANNGLTNTSGGAWATIQYACDYMAGVDANGYGVTIQVGDGSYAAASAGNQCVSILYRPRNALYFKIYGNTTTPANVDIDGVDQSPYGFLIGQNYVTNARQACIVDEIGGFEIKNAYSFMSVYSWSKARVVNCISRDNVIGVEAYEYSYVSSVNEFVFAGNHSNLLWAGTATIANSFNVSFESGATYDDVAFTADINSYIYTGGFDYTNLTASGGTQWTVNAFGYLDTSGTSGSIPGAAGSTDALGKVA